MTHGMCRTRTYKSWEKMKERCNNPNHKYFSNYGARGIKVCVKWLSFNNFYADMGERPVGMSLERKDGNKGYNKANCKWATRTEQNNNSTQNVRLTVDGVTKNKAQWARIAGIKRQNIEKRLKLGWCHKDAIFKPVRTHHKERTSTC